LSNLLFQTTIKKSDQMPNIYLKNLVDSWQETLDKDTLKEREATLLDRVEQEKDLAAEEEEREKMRAMYGSVRGRGRGRRGGRGTAMRRGMIQMTIVDMRNARQQAPIEISSESDSSNENSREGSSTNSNDDDE
jgi:hypothetical protein